MSEEVNTSFENDADVLDAIALMAGFSDDQDWTLQDLYTISIMTLVSLNQSHNYPLAESIGTVAESYALGYEQLKSLREKLLVSLSYDEDSERKEETTH